MRNMGWWMCILCIALWTIWSETQSSSSLSPVIAAEIGNHSQKENTTDNDPNDTRLIYTKHAKQRMQERHVNDNEVRKTLAVGELVSENDGKFKYEKTYITNCTFQGKRYPRKKVEVVMAPNENEEWVIITVIGDCKQ